MKGNVVGGNDTYYRAYAKYFRLWVLQIGGNSSKTSGKRFSGTEENFFMIKYIFIKTKIHSGKERKHIFSKMKKYIRSGRGKHILSVKKIHFYRKGKIHSFTERKIHFFQKEKYIPSERKNTYILENHIFTKCISKKIIKLIFKIFWRVCEKKCEFLGHDHGKWAK